MRPLFALYLEGFTWLRRDRIFVPIMLIGLGISVFASTASQWSLEDFQKILFDIGLAGFRLAGGLVAILWGIRMIHDALSERSLDPRLAAPISRSTWYLARYLSLATALVVMGVVFAVWWQAVVYFGGYGLLTNIQGWALGMLVMEWLILAALAMMLASFGSFGMAMFATLGLWIAGLLAPLVSATKDPTLPATQSLIVDWIADIWNFQRFNIIDQLGVTGQTINLADLTMRLSWSGSLLVAVVTAGIWRFTERDLG